MVLALEYAPADFGVDDRFFQRAGSVAGLLSQVAGAPVPGRSGAGGGRSAANHQEAPQGQYVPYEPHRVGPLMRLVRPLGRTRYPRRHGT
jgi:hypothetical protein